MPFVLGGGGISFASEAIPHGASYFNFLGEAGLGIQYALSARRALTLEWRFHHLSNGNTAATNPGNQQQPLPARLRHLPVSKERLMRPDTARPTTMWHWHGIVVAMLAASLLAGCGTLSNGRGWGKDAIVPVNSTRIGRAALEALLDVQTLLPAVGAAVFRTPPDTWFKIAQPSWFPKAGVGRLPRVRGGSGGLLVQSARQEIGEGPAGRLWYF
jgi:hypothetical protein